MACLQSCMLCQPRLSNRTATVLQAACEATARQATCPRTSDYGWRTRQWSSATSAGRRAASTRTMAIRVPYRGVPRSMTAPHPTAQAAAGHASVRLKDYPHQVWSTPTFSDKELEQLDYSGARGARLTPRP